MNKEQKEKALQLHDEYYEKLDRLGIPFIIIYPNFDEEKGSMASYAGKTDQLMDGIIDALNIALEDGNVSPIDVRHYKHCLEDACDDLFNSKLINGILDHFAEFSEGEDGEENEDDENTKNYPWKA